jgi:hypothetical protein
VSICWGAFRHLFVSGQEVVDLINDVAGEFVFETLAFERLRVLKR